MTAGVPVASLAAEPALGAATSSYRVDVWKTDEGLPQSSVTSIIQSREGYLWLGTFGGAVRFDGVRFTTFGSDRIPGLERRILSLFEDRRGAIWAGTEEGDLLRLDGGNLKSYSLPSISEPSARRPTVSCG